MVAPRIAPEPARPLLAPARRAAPRTSPFVSAPSLGTEPPSLALPPSLRAGTERESFRAGISRAKWMLGAYWLLTVSSLLALLGVFASRTIEGAATLPSLLGLWVLPCMLGLPVGHALALLRLRKWVVWVLAWVGTFAVSMATALLGPVALAGWAFVWSVACGHFVMQRRLALWSIWTPVVQWIGAILTLLEADDRLPVWLSGAKWEIWRPVPLALLFVAVVEIFLFFAGQERYHAAVWQADAAGDRPATRRALDAGGAGNGRGLGAIVLFAALVCGAVALVAPYLWRTGHNDNAQGHVRGHGDEGDGSGSGSGSGSSSGEGRGSGSESGGSSGEGRGSSGSGSGSGGSERGSSGSESGSSDSTGGSSGSGSGSSGEGAGSSGESGGSEQGQGNEGSGNGSSSSSNGNGEGSGEGTNWAERTARRADPDRVERGVDDAARQARRTGLFLLPFLPGFLVTRPIRRALLLRHLRRPWWRVPPSERAANLWRYVRIALGDARISAQPGGAQGSIDALVAAVSARDGAPPSGLVEFAEGYQRIRFGLGIEPNAIESLGANAGQAFVAIRAPLSGWQRLRSWWRKL